MAGDHSVKVPLDIGPHPTSRRTADMPLYYAVVAVYGRHLVQMMDFTGPAMVMETGRHRKLQVWFCEGCRPGAILPQRFCGYI